MKHLIALTGSIGSGKSAVAELLRQKGAVIIDADVIARELLQPSAQSYHQAIALLGSEIINADGSINRALVASKVFGDEKLRKGLEQILHPAVHGSYRQQLRELRQQQPTSVIVYVVPLLFETGMDLNEFEEIVVVSTTPERALDRVVQRDRCSLDHAKQRYAAQLPVEEKVARATFVIDNNGSYDELVDQVERLWSHLTSPNQSG